jgi:hypothetical protein
VRSDIVGDFNDVRPAAPADLGLRRNQIHDARLIRDAKAAEPGIAHPALDERLEGGEEPMRAALRYTVVDTAKRDMRPWRKPRRQIYALRCTSFWLRTRLPSG